MAGAALAVGLVRLIWSSLPDGVYTHMAHPVAQLAVPVAYARYAVAAHAAETPAARALHGVALGVVALVAFSRLGGWPAFAALLCAHAASRALACAMAGIGPRSTLAAAATAAQPLRRAATTAGWPLALAACALALGVLAAVGPTAARYLFPIEELSLAYSVASRFMGPAVLQQEAARLALVTIHCQVPLGYVGIAYLRVAQARKNRLLDVGRGQLGADVFIRSVAEFAAFTAVPYASQRTVIESINSHGYQLFIARLEASFRLESVLASGGALEASAKSELTIEQSASSLFSAVSTGYNLVERKLFSLPKLALAPGIIWRHPSATATALPLLLLLDVAKASAKAAITTRVEDLRRETQKLTSVRSKVEAHDAKHASLIRAAAAGGFTRRRWGELTARVQRLEQQQNALAALRNWIGWLYWQDALQPAIECGLALLLTRGHIELSDIWVYSRVVEDAIDTLLMRSRAEAQLARLHTDADRLTTLHDALTAADARAPLCTAPDGDGGGGALLSLEYSRGSARVTLSNVALPAAGTYAVEGPNGVGKSTLFSLLRACARRKAPPPDIELHRVDVLRLPGGVRDGSSVVELSQKTFCPLHARPIEWLAAVEGGAAAEETEAALAARFLTLASGLRLVPDDKAAELRESLLLEQDDFCGELSGGQRVKLALIRAVLLRSTCPSLLLLDESLAPLDPASKLLVIRELQRFCAQSLVLLIYHADEADADASACELGRGSFVTGRLVFDATGNVSVRGC